MSASARVQVTLLVSDLGTWGEDCTVGQIRKQAVEAAHRKVAALIGASGNDLRSIKVSGVPTVTDIIFGEEK